MKEKDLENFPNSFTETEEGIIRYLSQKANAKSARDISDKSEINASYHSVRKACNQLLEGDILDYREVSNGKADKLYYIPKSISEDLRVKNDE